jgi:hypothetical protein
MTGLLLGASSFILAFWADVASMRGTRALKPLLWAASIMLLLAGVSLMTVGQPFAFELAGAVRVVGWVLAGLSALLLAYSLFLEIPFA